MSGLQQVHVRVIDADTGRPTPCRVRFTDAQGKYYAPYGRLTEFATGIGIDVGGNLSSPWDKGGLIQRAQFAYIDGACEIELPPGLIHVTLCKGPEYLQFEQEITLAAGKLALRFTLQRWSDLRQHQWYGGDARAHFLSPPAALLEGAAEDLAVVNVLARTSVIQDYDDWDETTTPRSAHPNLLDFSGQQPALEREGCMVVVNTYNSHPHLGSLGLLNCHRVVYPLTFGGKAAANSGDNWTLADWCDQCHRKHGLVVWTKALLSAPARTPGEALADLVLGKVDAIEVEQFGYLDTLHEWSSLAYDLLNCGCKATLLGSSGKDSNHLPLGCVRCYARLQPKQPFNYSAWIEAVRAGRTIVTNGPLLQLTADGQDCGASLEVAAQQPVRVQAEARSVVPFEHLEILINGAVVAQASSSGNPCAARVDAPFQIPEGGWLAARCWGKAWVPGPFAGQRVYAHTSPIYVRTSGRPAPVDPHAQQRMFGHLTKGLSWVDNEGRYENDAQRLRLRKVFEDAILTLQERERTAAKP